MAQHSEEVIPTLQEVVANAERTLAGLRKDGDESRKWLENNVPDLNARLTTPATRALFATKLRAAIESQPTEIVPISAEQLVQALSKQVEDIQLLVQHKKAEIEEAKEEEQEAKEELESLARLRELRLNEGEMRHDERLVDKLASVNRLFKQQRKWLGAMIDDLYGEDDEISSLLRDLTEAYFSDGDPYISEITDNDRISGSLSTLISIGVVSTHPYEPDRVRLQDLS